MTRALFVFLRATLACVLCATSFHAPAQPRQRANPDEQILRQSRLVASGELVELYEDGIKVDPAFLGRLEDAYRGIEKLLGTPLDKAMLGDKVRVYVSDAASVSHVWNGYQHPRDPRGVILLSRVAYFGAMRGENATYAHEMTHLFTWRFHSHTLREGIADYVALQLMPGAAVGPNLKGYDWQGRLPDEVRVLLGTTIEPPQWVNNDPRLRQAYYFGSYRLVKSLIERGGLAKFQQLYAAAEPDAAFVELYGVPRAQLVDALE